MLEVIRNDKRQYWGAQQFNASLQSRCVYSLNNLMTSCSYETRSQRGNDDGRAELLQDRRHDDDDSSEGSRRRFSISRCFVGCSRSLLESPRRHPIPYRLLPTSNPVDWRSTFIIEFYLSSRHHPSYCSLGKPHSRSPFSRSLVFSLPRPRLQTTYPP